MEVTGEDILRGLEDSRPFYYEKKENGEYGIFSAIDFKKGDELFSLQGTISKEQDKYSVHIGNGLHIVDKNAKYMNHSFDPNCKFIGRRCFAKKDICGDDELTFNYLSTEERISRPFVDEETNRWVR